MSAKISSLRVSVDGKFFRFGERKFYVKGITYGPFAPDADGCTFASKEQTRTDFQLLGELGANLIRVYYVPPRWLLDLADEFGIKVLIDIPWPKHLCFLESYDVQQTAIQNVREAVTTCRDHSAVFAFSVANEIPAEVVRWSGAKRTAAFIDELIAVAKEVDPNCLCTFASYPPTEFLQPRSCDFICFNVYLHDRSAFRGYLARLQSIAGEKPLMLGEFGLDSIREGEAHKSEVLSWKIEESFRAGLAGTVVFSFTDDWFRGGRQIEDWAFGLTTTERTKKDSFRVVRELYSVAPYFPLSRTPKVSVVVASYNGERTLKTCLDSLEKLNYPDYEVILVDDGSTDNSAQIAHLHSSIRYIHHENRGLSTARNTGIDAATGEIVAFTDSDCRADEDWLFYLVSDLLAGNFQGVGGHNFLPPEDSPVAATVMASPGGPAHVMLTDYEAEHIPGCNMAFYKWALDAIKGFDPIFRKAGDDVDVCWRLQQLGCKIGFSHAGFVWHYRRSTVKAYLKQQEGYGEAEALLAAKHPEYFNALGSSMWRGRIYTQAKFGLLLHQPIIYHGVFGSGFFQTLYSPRPSHAVMLLSSLEYHCLLTVPLLLLSSHFPLLLAPALTALGASFAVCLAAGVQADLALKKERLWSRPLVAALFFLQPLIRGWARYKSQFNLQVKRRKRTKADRSYRNPDQLDQICYWSKNGTERYAFLDKVIQEAEKDGWTCKLDTGWNAFDVEILGGHLTVLRLVTVVEELGNQKQFFRCRLETHWSVLTKILFGATTLIELVLILRLAPLQPWLWMMLLTLPVFIWCIQSVLWNQQAALASAVDKAADVFSFEKYERV